MKKWLLVLGIITCMLGLTACKTEEEVKDHYGITEEAAGTFAQNFIESMDKVVLNNEVEQYKDDEIIYVLDPKAKVTKKRSSKKSKTVEA